MKRDVLIAYGVTHIAAVAYTLIVIGFNSGIFVNPFYLWYRQGMFAMPLIYLAGGVAAGVLLRRRHKVPNASIGCFGAGVVSILLCIPAAVLSGVLNYFQGFHEYLWHILDVCRFIVLPSFNLGVVAANSLHPLGIPSFLLWGVVEPIVIVFVQVICALLFYSGTQLSRRKPLDTTETP